MVPCHPSKCLASFGFPFKTKWSSNTKRLPRRCLQNQASGSNGTRPSKGSKRPAGSWQPADLPGKLMGQFTKFVGKGICPLRLQGEESSASKKNMLERLNWRVKLQERNIRMHSHGRSDPVQVQPMCSALLVKRGGNSKIEDMCQLRLNCNLTC